MFARIRKEVKEGGGMSSKKNVLITNAITMGQIWRGYMQKSI